MNISLRMLIQERIRKRFGFSLDECRIIANEVVEVIKEYAYNTKNFVIPGVCRQTMSKKRHIVMLKPFKQLKFHIKEREIKEEREKQNEIDVQCPREENN